MINRNIPKKPEWASMWDANDLDDISSGSPTNAQQQMVAQIAAETAAKVKDVFASREPPKPRGPYKPRQPKSDL